MMTNEATAMNTTEIVTPPQAETSAEDENTVSVDNTLEKEKPVEPEKPKQMEMLEEAKLKAKYPQAMRPGGSSFLQKRLNKGTKYFDSGDYNMAKAKGPGGKIRPSVLAQPTGDAIPTPDNLPAARKTSMVQSKLAANLT